LIFEGGIKNLNLTALLTLTLSRGMEREEKERI